MSRAVLEIGADLVPPVPSVSGEYLEGLAKDPDVVDWLISCSDRPSTREDYLDSLGRFLNWNSWTPGEVFRIKKEAMKEGEPLSLVEKQIRRYDEALKRMGYAGLTRAQGIAALYSFIGSKGYTVKRKLVRFDMSTKTQLRVPTREEVDLFVQYAKGMEKKLLYTLLTESPCRPRVFLEIRWNWLEAEWWTRDVIHVALPKQFRPVNQSGPKKFEPVCFFGPKAVNLLKQMREAKIRTGKIPLETDRILNFTYDAVRVTVHRDYERLIELSLVRPSRRDEKGELTEQPITPKSWRKYGFNMIDACVDISPEWRKMLKGRDLQTERYYSRENIEALREIYHEKIYPQLWSDTQAPQNMEGLKALGKENEHLRNDLSKLAQDFAQLKGQFETAFEKKITKET